MLTTLLYILLSFHLSSSLSFYTPQHVHISYGDSAYEITVTWSTWNETIDSVVEYGIGELNYQAQGKAQKFSQQGREQYIHRVKLGNLIADSKYLYHCGSNDGGWSDLFYFLTPPTENWRPRLAIYGDMGSENPQSLPRLQEEIANGLYDAVLHVGDFAYDMNSNNDTVGDDFMQQIQPIAAYVPYMTCPGNHEEMFNFSNYRARFSMPGGTEGLMYSFNMGPVHFIAISTEFYYFTQYGLKLPIKQYMWLEKDLEEATQEDNRSKRPWIVVFGHRPMYCSNGGLADCNNYNTRVRTGVPALGMFGLEDLFFTHGVDLEIWAHEHSYERLWPLYNYTVYNGSTEEPYRNPQAPVHIITGSAGCKEDITPFLLPQPRWSAFRSTDYGYTRMQVFNDTHMHLEQVSDDKKGEIIDSIWIIKDKHEPFTTEDDNNGGY